MLQINVYLYIPLFRQHIYGIEANSFRAGVPLRSQIVWRVVITLDPKSNGLFFKHTVRVVAVGIPSLASVEANPIINNTSFSKTTVGSSFYYGITNSALCHPASSTYMETCNREKMRHRCYKSILGKKLSFLFK